MPAKKAPAKIEPPPALESALVRSKPARAAWDALAPSHRREYAEWIASAKRDETRERRVSQAIDMLANGRKTPMRANDAPSTSANPLAKKMLVKPESTVIVLNAPEGFSALQGATSGKGDVVLAFVRNAKDVARFGKRALAATTGDSVWLAYPKKTSGIETDLSRDHGWETMTEAGYQTVALVAIDDDWSAVRFRRKS